MNWRTLWVCCGFWMIAGWLGAQTPIEISGIYPHLAMFNDENECGTGAVVPWAERLWVVTYAPHQPKGSTDKLYEITNDLAQIVRPESIGGTPANRMIHRESNQLFIGPYAIAHNGQVRVIDYSKMFGRPTGNARHLVDPAGKLYYATMEEGLYEVDVKSLAVTELWADEQVKAGRHANLPGYHGKGLYSGQGRLIYANNGEHGSEALKVPETPSGVLASWDGKTDQWTIVRRNQFTEVTGPAGIQADSVGQADDPIWAIGWDHRSLILQCLYQGKWSSFRLPKASHSYDGAHGWNTEWPRIRDIGEKDLLMTMHGMFWRFPRTFNPMQTSGIAPRSTYLKVVGDFCRWQDRIVLGCDDTAKSEFLNKRKAKGEIAAPQSQSNLWFLQPDQLDKLGPVLGRGAVWLDDELQVGAISEPMLFSGFERRALHLNHTSNQALTLEFELDEVGNNQWRKWRQHELPAHGSAWLDLSDAPPAAWIRLKSGQAGQGVTAWFTFANRDQRTSEPSALLRGIASIDQTPPSSDKLSFTGGTLRARGGNKRTLHFLADKHNAEGNTEIGLYELDGTLTLKPDSDSAARQYQQQHAAIPEGALSEDDASILYVDDAGKRWRLPRATGDLWSAKQVISRVCREVATERDLFNAGGTFYELPAENAGGFAKVRAIATHASHIIDYCSYRGLLVMSGITADATISNPHLIRSSDQKTAVWVGAVDDVWQFGKPRGVGGPWKNSAVKANEPSDAYLLTGFDRKTLSLSHDALVSVRFHIECDVTGTGMWLPFREVNVESGKAESIIFPEAYAAYWLRAKVDRECRASCQLTYE